MPEPFFFLHPEDPFTCLCSSAKGSPSAEAGSSRKKVQKVRCGAFLPYCVSPGWTFALLFSLLRSSIINFLKCLDCDGMVVSQILMDPHRHTDDDIARRFVEGLMTSLELGALGMREGRHAASCHAATQNDGQTGGVCGHVN